MPYTLKVKTIKLSNEANDRTVILTCNLTDSLGVPFTDANNKIETFTVRAPSSSVPGSGYLAYLTALAVIEIAKKYDKTLQGEGTNGSDTLLFSEASVAGLFTELLVDGPGLSSVATLDSIIATTEILLSSTLTLDFSGDTTSPDIVYTGTPASGSQVITGMSSTTDLVGGMTIIADGVPTGAVIIAIDSGALTVTASQQALSSPGAVSITFSSNNESNFVKSLSPAIFNDSYVGMTIKGTNILNTPITTIAEVISTSRIRLSQPATGTTSATYTLSSPIGYFFDTGGLSINYSDLQRVVDIIDFSLL